MVSRKILLKLFESSEIVAKGKSVEQFVFDASVVAKWFFEEELKEEADFLFERVKRNEIAIVVPETLYVELASVFRKKVQQKIVTLHDALETFDRAMGFPFKSYPTQEICDVALENALHFGITVYDALYLSVAEIYVAPFVTADRSLFQACRGRFDFIEYLGDLKEK